MLLIASLHAKSLHMLESFLPAGCTGFQSPSPQNQPDLDARVYDYNNKKKTHLRLLDECYIPSHTQQARMEYNCFIKNAPKILKTKIK